MLPLIPSDTFSTSISAATSSATSRCNTAHGLAPVRFGRILVAELVRLEDSASKGLRGYGSVDPRVEHLIDPRLQTLHILLATMLARLGHSPVRSAPTPPEDP